MAIQKDRGREEKEQSRSLLKEHKRASGPWDSGLQPFPASASPSGALSPSPGPFSPPLLVSLLIIWLNPIAQTLPV